MIKIIGILKPGEEARNIGILVVEGTHFFNIPMCFFNIPIFRGRSTMERNIENIGHLGILVSWWNIGHIGNFGILKNDQDYWNIESW